MNTVTLRDVELARADGPVYLDITATVEIDWDAGGAHAVAGTETMTVRCVNCQEEVPLTASETETVAAYVREQAEADAMERAAASWEP